MWDDFKVFAKDYGSVVAAITALSLAGGFGRWLLSKFYKPKLEILSLRSFKQYKDLTLWRFAIKNKGNEIAKNVQADVIAIYDNDKKRIDFLPVPLKWTHRTCEPRNILPFQ